jgi:hypothetical protein
MLHNYVTTDHFIVKMVFTGSEIHSYNNRQASEKVELKKQDTGDLQTKENGTSYKDISYRKVIKLHVGLPRRIVKADCLRLLLDPLVKECYL